MAMGELALMAWAGRADSAPCLRGAAPGAQTDQLSYHPGLHPAAWVDPPNTYRIYDLLECVKERVLWNDICRISVTWVGQGISERSLGEGPAMIADCCQKPETLNHNNDSL